MKIEYSAKDTCLPRFVLVIALLLISLAPAKAQQHMGTRGTDFWVAFLKNFDNYTRDSYYLQLQAPRSCLATISNPNTGWDSIITLQAGTAVNFLVPYQQVYLPGSDVIRNTGLHVTATDSITLISANKAHDPSSMDATFVLPTYALGNEYIVQTYPTCTTKTPRECEFSVLSVVDSTIFDIYFNGVTADSVHRPGDSITVLLNAGQVYQVMGTDRISDLGGTYVRSRKCTPFALFHGNTGAYVPIVTGTSSDNIFHQALPPRDWGSQFLLTASREHNHDYVRLTAGHDSTEIRCTFSSSDHHGAYDTLLAVLNARQVFEFDFHNVCFVQTSSPVQLYQYLDSRNTGYIGSDWGDISMFAPNPLNQPCTQAVFTTFPLQNRLSNQSRYRLNIVVPAGEEGLLRLDGDTIGSFDTIPFNPFYRYVRLVISDSSHSLTTSGKGFYAHTYGLGENWESYAFSLGIDPTPAAAIGPSLMLGSVNVNGSTLGFCADTLLQFRVSAPYDIAECRGYIDGQSAPMNGTLLNASFGVGQHDVMVVVVPEVSDCYNAIDTLRAFVNVQIPAPDTIFLDTCADAYTWFGSILTTSGYYSQQITSSLGCDSLVVLSLDLHPTYRHQVQLDTCGPAYRWNDTLRTESGFYNALFQSQFGCDSAVALFLMLHDCAPDTVIDTSDVWFPNAFTPGETTNNRFQVSGSDVTDVEVFIYRRWGTLVTHWKGLDGYWDGTRRGHPCPQETYVVLIRYRSASTNDQHEHLGTVTILR